MTTSIAIHWRLNSQRYQLMGSVYSDCGHTAFPPRPECPVCAEPRPSLSLSMPAQPPILAQLPRLALVEEVSA